MTSDDGPSGAPHFDVVFRGYDRRQVDEHVTRLHRVIARMRADLSARGPVDDGGAPPGWPGAPGQMLPAGHSPDAIAGFTDRMQRILQSAEEEAAEIRRRARFAAEVESQQARRQLDDLVQERQRMLRELAQIRGQLPQPGSAEHTARLPRSAPGGEYPRGPLPSPRPRPPVGPPSPRPAGVDPTGAGERLLRPPPEIPAARQPTGAWPPARPHSGPGAAETTVPGSGSRPTGGEPTDRDGPVRVAPSQNGSAGQHQPGFGPATAAGSDRNEPDAGADRPVPSDDADHYPDVTRAVQAGSPQRVRVNGDDKTSRSG